MPNMTKRNSNVISFAEILVMRDVDGLNLVPALVQPRSQGPCSSRSISLSLAPGDVTRRDHGNEVGLSPRMRDSK